MLIVRGIKVHDDTHRVLKQLKVRRRSRSIDEVIRELIKNATGKSIEQLLASSGNLKLTNYMQKD